MAKLQMFERVVIKDSPATSKLGAAGLQGTILAVSVDEATAITYYTVLVRALGCTAMVSAEDLRSLGEFEDPGAIYDGTRLRVTRNGKVVP